MPRPKPLVRTYKIPPFLYKKNHNFVCKPSGSRKSTALPDSGFPTKRSSSIYWSVERWISQGGWQLLMLTCNLHTRDPPLGFLTPPHPSRTEFSTDQGKQVPAKGYSGSSPTGVTGIQSKKTPTALAWLIDGHLESKFPFLSTWHSTRQ